MTEAFQPDLFSEGAEPVETGLEAEPFHLDADAIAAAGTRRFQADQDQEAARAAAGEGRALDTQEEAVGRIPTQGEMAGLRTDASNYRYDKGPGKDPHNPGRWKGHLDTATRESGTDGVAVAKAKLGPTEAEKRRVKQIVESTRRGMGVHKPYDPQGAVDGDTRAEGEAIDFIARVNRRNGVER